MNASILLITDQTSVRHQVADHTRELPLVVRGPRQATPADWEDAALVLLDAHAAPAVAAGQAPRRHPSGVTLLVDPTDLLQGEVYRHAAVVGATRLITLPDRRGALRAAITAAVGHASMLVAVVDPAATGDVGTVTATSLALAGVTEGLHVGLLDARPSAVALHHALQRAELDAPAGTRAMLRVLSVPGESPPPGWALGQALTELAGQGGMTVAHLDPHHPDTWAVLPGVDLVIVAIPATAVTADGTRHVVASARSYTPNTHVHATGVDLDTEVTDALAAGMRAGYSSMTAVAAEYPPQRVELVSDHRHRSFLWAVINRYRRPPQPPNGNHRAAAGSVSRSAEPGHHPRVV
jgi:hypothetical protein